MLGDRWIAKDLKMYWSKSQMPDIKQIMDNGTIHDLSFQLLEGCSSPRYPPARKERERHRDPDFILGFQLQSDIYQLCYEHIERN